MADQSYQNKGDRDRDRSGGGGRSFSQRSSSSSSSSNRPGGNRGPRQQGGDQERNNTSNNFKRGGRFQRRRKVCLYCAEKDRVIHWKKTDEFRRFVGGSGEIYPRRKTGTCAKHQRQIAIAIKRARHIALLPYTSEHVRVTSKH